MEIIDTSEKAEIKIRFLKSIVRNAGGAVLQGEGRSLEKGTCIDFDVIMTSEYKLKGYFSQAYALKY